MRRKLFFSVLLLAGIAGAPHAATAQAPAYPSKTITFIVPYAPGNAIDLLARLLADKMGPALKQPIIVQNFAGSNSVLGTGNAVRAAADGYTVLIDSSTSYASLPILIKDLPFDMQKSLEPVALIAEAAPLLVVPANSPINSIGDLVAMAKKDSSAVLFGSANPISQFAAAQLRWRAGINFVTVPYKATQQAFGDLVSGRVTFMFNGLGTSRPFLEQKSIKAIATTGQSRIAALPNVPAVAETYPGFSSMTWFVASVPAGTPKAIVERLNGEFNEALKDAGIKDKMAAAAYDIKTGTPAQAREAINSDIALWKKVAQEANWNPQ